MDNERCWDLLISFMLTFSDATFSHSHKFLKNEHILLYKKVRSSLWMTSYCNRAKKILDAEHSLTHFETFRHNICCLPHNQIRLSINIKSLCYFKLSRNAFCWIMESDYRWNMLWMNDSTLAFIEIFICLIDHKSNITLKVKLFRRQSGFRIG